MTADTSALSTRLINALAAGEQQTGGYRYFGGPRYAVVVHTCGDPAIRREGTSHQMWAWLDGYQRGRLIPEHELQDGGVGLAKLQLRNDEHLADIRQVLVDSPLIEQLRIRVLAAMEQRKVTYVRLAEDILYGEQAVRQALQFGTGRHQHKGMGLFEAMIRALQIRSIHLRWPPPYPPPASVGGLASDDPEPSGVRRLRALLIAADDALIGIPYPLIPNRARSAKRFTLQVVGEEVTRPRETLIHWLQGVADGAGNRRAAVALTEKP